MSGSWGTLGGLTEVSLKVLPSVEATPTLVLPDLTPEQAVAAMSAALGSPYEVSGAAWIEGAVWLRLEGFASSVDYRAKALVDLLASHGSVTRDDSADWTRVRDAQPLHGCSAVWRVSVKPSDGPAVIASLPSGSHAMMDWGGGLIWIGQDTADAGVHAHLQTTVATFGGHATLIKAPDEIRTTVSVFQPEVPGVAAISAALRARFDPRGILNPGLMAA